MISREEFEEKVKELVNKDNDNLKYLSSAYKGMSIVLGVLGVLGLFGSFPLTFAIGFYLGPVLMVLCIVSLVIAIVRACKTSKANKYYEDNYLDRIVNILLSDVTHAYFKNEYIREDVFNDSKFGGYYNRYKGSDLLMINIPNDNSDSNNNLVLCDLVVEADTSSDDEPKNINTVYKGIFGYVDFPCEFKCDLFLNVYSLFSGLQKIELEDMEFNKTFKIYSTDQIEARCILTPDMMEKLLNLSKKAGKIKVTIIKDKLYIGFENLNLFEMKGVKNGDVSSMFRGCYDTINVIMDVVEEIKNNNKIFKI